MLKKLRFNHPVWFCVLMVVLAYVFISIGNVVGSLLPGAITGTTCIIMCMGNVFAALLFMLEHFGTDRSGILKAVFISAALFGAMRLIGMTGGADPVGIQGQTLSARLSRTDHPVRSFP